MPEVYPKENITLGFFSRRRTIAKEIRSLEDWILTGLQRRIQDVFGLHADYKYTVDPFLQSDGTRKATLPLAYLKFLRMRPRTDDTARHGLSYQWIPGSTTEDGNSYFAYQFFPVYFDLTFTYVAEKFLDIQKLMNAWVFAWRKNSLGFTVTYDGINVDIRCQLAEAQDVPWQEDALDDQIWFEYENDIQILGYISQKVEVKRDTLSSVDLQIESVAPGVLADPAQIDQVVEKMVLKIQADGSEANS